MPVQSRGASFRARIQVAGSRHHGPWRGCLAAAEADPLTCVELSHSCTVSFLRPKQHGQNNTLKDVEALSVRISRRVDILTVVLEEL